MIPSEVLQAISKSKLPCFIYDGAEMKRRIALAASLLDFYFFPIKACPEPAVLREVVSAGYGLDLCSEGDLELAIAADCPGERMKFTSACVEDALLQRLCRVGARFDADSLDQGLRWKARGAAACGLRLTAKAPKGLYGQKFGIPAPEITSALQGLARAGMRVEGLHLHDQHSNLEPAEFGAKLVESLAQAGREILSGCRYVNIGGSWPMRHGKPAAVEELRIALEDLRKRLSVLGFKGALYAEPGRWVAGPCGYWAARVAALKSHVSGEDHKVVVLDTSTPVPCRPSLAPFLVVRDGELLRGKNRLTCDLFGSANTAVDSIGLNVRLPEIAAGDVIVSLGQGAYTRALIPPFNERERPIAVVLGTGSRKASVFVFNPFAEGYIAEGNGFTPVRHQAMLAEDLAALPQFLAEPKDVVLLNQHPAASFLSYLSKAGFPAPTFIELRAGETEVNERLRGRPLGSLRPWAWGPDSVKLLQSLVAEPGDRKCEEKVYFNGAIAQLYSKAWSADFLRRLLADLVRKRARRGDEVLDDCLCTEQEAGVAVNTLGGALEAIREIRSRGHHPIVVKQAFGLAGHNALRFWEPDILPAQKQWLSSAVEGDRVVVVEPWLTREMDFSIQLEMGPRGLHLCGFTGLVTDGRGQFLANWAEPHYKERFPAEVGRRLSSEPGIMEGLSQLYARILELLEADLQRVGFTGPIGIDAFIYRSAEGRCRLKPVVEINPRYTMGRVTIELMKHVSPGSYGLFRLVTRAQARSIAGVCGETALPGNGAGGGDFASYASWLAEHFPLRMENDALLREGVLCLNDPGRAQACLATFQTGAEDGLSEAIQAIQHQRDP